MARFAAIRGDSSAGTSSKSKVSSKEATEGIFAALLSHTFARWRGPLMGVQMVRTRHWLGGGAALVLLGLAVVVVAQAADDENDAPDLGAIHLDPDAEAPTGVPAGHSEIDYRTAAFDKALASGSDDPFLLPVELPPGQADQVPFLVDGFPITDVAPAGRTWLSQFTADALPPADGDVTGFEVYQVPMTGALPNCAPSQSVERTVDDNRLVVCLGPRPTPAAREYWATVPFSSQLSDIKWMTPEGADE